MALSISSSNQYDETLQELLEELRPAVFGSLIVAVRSRDLKTIRNKISKVDTAWISDLKVETISSEWPTGLQFLLDHDGLIDEAMIDTACKLENRALISILLDSGWDIDRSLFSSASLLCTAINNLDLLKWFIHKGADVNVRNSLDEPVLSIAIAHGSMDVVKFLLDSGAHIEHGDLLHCAAQRKEKSEGAELVRILAKEGANVNKHRYDNPVAFRWRGMFMNPTPLHVACEQRNVHVAGVLLEYGADPLLQMLQAKQPAGLSSLEVAIQIDDQALINLLQESLSTASTK